MKQYLSLYALLLTTVGCLQAVPPTMQTGLGTNNNHVFGQQPIKQNAATKKISLSILNDPAKLQAKVLQHPERINNRVNTFADTLIMQAVRQGNFKAVQFLLSKKADITLQNKAGETVLVIAKKICTSPNATQDDFAILGLLTDELKRQNILGQNPATYSPTPVTKQSIPAPSKVVPEKTTQIPTIEIEPSKPTPPKALPEKIRLDQQKLTPTEDKEKKQTWDNWVRSHPDISCALEVPINFNSARRTLDLPSPDKTIDDEDYYPEYFFDAGINEMFRKMNAHRQEINSLNPYAYGIMRANIYKAEDILTAHLNRLIKIYEAKDAAEKSNKTKGSAS